MKILEEEWKNTLDDHLYRFTVVLIDMMKKIYVEDFSSTPPVYIKVDEVEEDEPLTDDDSGKSSLSGSLTSLLKKKP